MTCNKPIHIMNSSLVSPCTEMGTNRVWVLWPFFLKILFWFTLFLFSWLVPSLLGPCLIFSLSQAYLERELTIVRICVCFQRPLE